jgi:hypothetical protein
VCTILLEVREQVAALNLRLARYDQQIASHVRSSDVGRRSGVLLGGRSGDLECAGRHGARRTLRSALRADPHAREPPATMDQATK